MEETRTRHTQAALDHLAGLLKHAQEQSDSRDGSISKSIASLATSLSLSIDTHRLATGLETLLQHRRLPPQWVHAGALRTRLSGLEAKAALQGMTLAANTLAEVLALEVSFAAYAGGKLRIVLHLPLRRREDLFYVRRYLPVPFRDNSSRWVQLHPGHDQLLLVDNEEQRWTLRDRNLPTGCTWMQDSQICRDIHVIRRARASGCLWALFQGKL